MGKLLPERHPNKDFFILDVSDANPRDEMASMEHPLYSLSTKPDHRELEYTASTGDRLVVIPSGKGLATIMDKDIVLYCISKLVAEAEAEIEISKTVTLSAHEVMVACNWRTNDAGYKRFEDALVRLAGTIIKTDITTGDMEETRGFGLISAFRIVKRKPDGRESAFGRMSRVEITLSDWTYRAIEAREVLAIHPGYFRLRRPLERRMYEVARKHMGNDKSEWRIGLAKLQAKMGSKSSLKKFRFNVREIIGDSNIPEFGVALTDRDVVIFKRREMPEGINEGINNAPLIVLRPDTVDKVQEIAAQLRISYTELYAQWCAYCHKTGERLREPDAAFIAFAKRKRASHAGGQKAATFDDGRQLGLVLDGLLPQTSKP